jgi:hypothetical protein
MSMPGKWRRPERDLAERLEDAVGRLERLTTELMAERDRLRAERQAKERPSAGPAPR